jgi:HlyD family secretion protein
MDRKIEKKKWTLKKITVIAIVGLFIVFSLYSFLSSGSGSRLNVDRDRITISAVRQGEFLEFIPVSGTVIPLRTIYLDAIEGGRVQKIHIEDGSFIEEGDTILTLTNNTLQLDVFNREAQILEQINNLQNTRLNLQQQRLRLREQVLDHEYQMMNRKRIYNQNKELWEKNLISEREFLDSKEAYEQTERQHILVSETLHLDSLATENQLRHIESSLARMMTNLELVQRSLDNLVLTAPVTGQLTSLNAEIGESKVRGERLGQVDILEGFRVRASIDEHYIARIDIGQQGEFDFAGQTYTLEITRVYPQVYEGRFEVDMEFIDREPDNIRRGQTLRIRLALGALEEAVLLARGGFFQRTGGQWVFIIEPSGNQAVKRNIRLGRQNPQYFEVIDGLEPGEQVITSSYDGFGDIDRLVLKCEMAKT